MPGPFPFGQILAADPSNPSMVARNDQILIFAPGDSAMTPLTIWDLTHTIQLTNPLTVNDLGFGPAFIHDTLDQVAWSGGGLSGTFESYRGMRDEAVAARVAAQAAAALVGAPADDVVSAVISDSATTANLALLAQVNSELALRVSPLVSDAISKDPAVAQSAATMAQSTAGIIPAWKASTSYTSGQRVIAPNGDVVAAKASFTSTATFDGTKWNASAQSAAFTQGLDAAQAAAISDATTKYGGLPTRIDSLEKANGTDLVTNGSFRDGLTGWGNTGGWTVGNGAATTWARTTLGSDGSLTQSIVIPVQFLGKTLRLYARAMTTSAGTLFMRVTTTAGNTDSSQVLATGPYVLKTMDIPIPANQGTTPVVLNVGRYSGTVYMTAIRLEAL